MKLAIAQKETVLTVRQHREFKRRLAISDKQAPKPYLSLAEIGQIVSEIRGQRGVRSKR
jgi:hypothetical protein